MLRIRPTSMFASRSSSACRANRAVSSDSRPSDLTTSAPSKDSCATALTSPRSDWACATLGDSQRW
jgi:hypothetical protein